MNNARAFLFAVLVLFALSVWAGGKKEETKSPPEKARACQTF